MKYSHYKHEPKPITSLGKEIPVHPWSKLATDIFHFEDASYLLTVDYTSRFLIVGKLTSMTGVHVANQCKQVFSENGWCHTLISDNGPCYTSQALMSVMWAFSVNHIISSPHYPESNGHAEKYVQIVKCLFNKAKGQEKDIYKCLMVYQNTPLTGCLQLPMQILQGRSARSDLPMSNAARKQLGIQPEVLQNIDKHEVLPTHDLQVGKNVMYQKSVTKWWQCSCHNKLMSRKEKLQDNNKWWCCIQTNSNTSQALYTPKQNTVCVTTNGTIRSYVTSDTTNGTIWPHKVFKSGQLITSTYKQT